MSLQVVECVLEYNAKLQTDDTPVTDDALLLPKVKTQKFPEKQLNVLPILVGMISDTNFLFELLLVRRLLPEQFPCFRNPFILAKDVDDVAAMDVTPPLPGDMKQVITTHSV